MKYIKFYWEEDTFQIVAFSDNEDTAIIKKLLDEYRKNEPYYNILGFMLHLKKNGVFAYIVKPEESIFF